MINSSPSPEEIAAEAREALRKLPKETSREHFRRLVRNGWINARGEVTKVLGGKADPEPNHETWDEENQPARKAL
jgi:hypothetical protein